MSQRWFGTKSADVRRIVSRVSHHAVVYLGCETYSPNKAGFGRVIDLLRQAASVKLAACAQTSVMMESNILTADGGNIISTECGCNCRGI